LNNLVGKKILVGNVEVVGIDLCRPCRHLTEVLEQDNILKEFLRRGGLRCQVLSSSSIKVGDKIKVLD
jgi:MOSC domain-containing protein YiiM